MTTIKSAALVVIESGSFGRPKTSIWKESVGSLFIRIGNGRPIEFLSDEHWGFAFAGMKDGKGVIAKSTLQWVLHNYWRCPICEELRASCEVFICMALGCCSECQCDSKKA